MKYLETEKFILRLLFPFETTVVNGKQFENNA